MSAGIVPVPLGQPIPGDVDEIGPAVLLPTTGQAFFIGANGNTALYTPSTNTWTAGPTYAGKATDAPAAVLPDGDVLFAADGNGSIQNPPTLFFDYHPATQTITQLTNLPPALTSVANILDPEFSQFLDLPNGQVLWCDTNATMWLYTPPGSANAAWQPQPASIHNNGDSNFTLTGTQLNGMDEGSAYGDDAENSTNFPLVQTTNYSNTVSYDRTLNWSSTGVDTGAAPEAVQFISNGAVAQLMTVSGAGVQSNADLMILMSQTASNITLRIDPNSGDVPEVEVLSNGNFVAEFPELTSLSVLVSGGQEKDTLTIDYTYGDPIQDGLNFAAGSGLETLNIVGLFGVSNQSYTLASASLNVSSPARSSLSNLWMDANDSNMTLRVDPNNHSVLDVVDGSSTFTYFLNSASPLLVTGGPESDTLTVDYSNGNPVPGGLNFIGGGGGDVLNIDDQTDPTAKTYTVTNWPVTIGGAAHRFHPAQQPLRQRRRRRQHRQRAEHGASPRSTATTAPR